jgi:hypothetical protein
MKKIFKFFTILLMLFLAINLQAAEIQVKKITHVIDLPENFCSVWQQGDYLISDGETLAVIGASSRPMGLSNGNYKTDNAMGSIISFVPAGQNLKCDMAIGSPYIKIKEKREYVYYTGVTHSSEESQGKDIVFTATGHYDGENGEKLAIKTTYTFTPETGNIAVTSRVKNNGDVEITELDYSLYVGAYHNYSFNPFHEEEHPALNFRFYAKKGYSLGWLNLNPPKKDDDPMPGNLRPGEDYSIRYSLVVDKSAATLLDRIYKSFQQKTIKSSFQFENFEGSTFEIIVRDALTSSVFYRSFHKKTPSLEIPLPEGVYKVRAHFFPAVVEKLVEIRSGEENICEIEDLPRGTVKVKITDSTGTHVPGKVSFIGMAETKTPYFLPENPVENGRRWESAKNSKFPPKEGLDVQLPVGTYLVTASQGPEHSRDQETVEVLAGEHTDLTFTVDRVLDTTGFVSVDPHMHTLYSDGRVGVEERIRSVVAEGVDVAIATDHNIIIDYLPILHKLGLENELATIIGNEVTVRGLIHYNTFPLTYRGDEDMNGAILALVDKAQSLFEASRQKDPGVIIQVNHPRAGTIGYFNNLELDLESAATSIKNFDTTFDVLESLNGPHAYSANEVAIQDWLNLLNRGYYKPLVGSSDAHSIDRDEPGYSRTYVYYNGAKGKDLDTTAVIEAIKKGHSFASNSPFVELFVNKSFIPGDSCSTKDGKVNVHVKVRSAPWVSVDEVRILLNGERKLVFPVKAESDKTVKFDEDIVLTLDQDVTIIAEVLGKKSLYPVVQRTSKDGLLEEAVIPYALTNPVFVDVDGNGIYDPPMAHAIEIVESKGKQNFIER